MNLYFCYVIKTVLYCHLEMYSCIRTYVKTVDVMSTPKTWATFWPKTMNEVITMQTHWSRCGQQKKQVTLWPMKETGHFVANERNRSLCGQ